MSELKIVCKQAKNIGAEKKVTGKGWILSRRVDSRDAVANDKVKHPALTLRRAYGGVVAENEPIAEEACELIEAIEHELFP